MTVRRTLARTVARLNTVNAVRRGPAAVAKRSVRRRAHRTLNRTLAKVFGR